MTSRQRRYQKEMVQRGRCGVCGQGAVVKGYCQRHYEAHKARKASHRERKGGAKQEQFCSQCGEAGHNKRTCPEQEVEAGA